MIANYLIGLREGLEATLVVSILIAYLVRTDRRSALRPIWIGVAVAVALSLGLGALLTFGPRGLSEVTQEKIAGSLSILAVGFVTWMIFWMARAARQMGAGLRERVDSTEGSAWSLVVLAVLAVGREGLETALFLWAATQAATREATASAGTVAPTWQPLLGAVLGLATAVVLGWLLYRGAVSINLSRFFTWTGGFLVLVAAGVLAYGVHELQEAGVLPGLGVIAYDVSGAIDPGAWYAVLVKGVFNLSPVASVLEVVVWVVYVVVTMSLFLRSVRRRATPPASGAPAPAEPTPTAVAGAREPR